MKNYLPNLILYKKLGKRLQMSVAMVLFSATVFAQVEVTGRVTSDEDQGGIPGVNIAIKGTSQGTVSDYQGNYKLSVPSEDAILIFSFVGYEAHEVTINGQSKIDVVLASSAQSLSEVVVTALGVKRETKALGYAVQEIKGEEMTKARETNVVNSLSGKVAGVQVTNGSSGVGSTSLITIRGESSLIPGNNSPLFVVDGIPINNQTRSNRSEGNLETDYGNGAAEINPDDIETMTVLKGANASALYGSRGANGVILITTKSGKGRKGIGVSVNSGVTFESPLQLPNYQNEYGQGAGGQFSFVNGSAAGVNDGVDESWGPKLDGSLITQHDSPTSSGVRAGDFLARPRDAGGNFTDTITPTPWIAHPNNIEDFFETGVTLNNNVAFAGGNDDGTFRLSFTKLDNTGIMPNTDLKRKTIALSANYKLSDKLRVNGSVNYINSSSKNRGNNSYGTENPMYLWVWFGRQIDMNSLRNYWQPGFEGVQQYNYNYNWHDNPFFTMFENTNGFNKNRIIGNISLTYNFTDDLSLMVRSGTDFFNDKRVSKRAFSTQRFSDGQYREDNIFFQETNTDFMLTYDKELSTDWALKVSGGANRRDVTDNYNRTSANQLLVPNVYNFGNAAIPLVTSQFDQQKRVNSVYGFANIGYKNMIFLDITARNDWSSTLPANNNSYFYPSVSLSAIVTDMLEVSSNSALSFAKIRGGWAQVGNDTNPYNLANTFSFNQPHGGTQIGSESSTLKNNELKPETQTSFEVGADLRFFNGRLGLDFTYYKADNKNQIIGIPVDRTSGYSQKIINAGKIQNNGIELMLSATPIDLGNSFKWNMNVNFTRNRSKVIALSPEDNLDTYVISGNYLTVVAKVGERMGDVYGTGFEEVQEGEFKGQIIHDENGFSKRDPKLKKLGNYNPDFMMGFSNSFSYKGINFDFLFDWRKGGVIMSRTILIGGTSGMMDFTTRGREDGIISEGVIENADGTYRKNDKVISSRDYHWWNYNRGNEEKGMFDASFVKLREVKLGYTLPNKMMGGLPFRDVTFSIVGRNLALWTEQSHFDPEAISFNGGTIVPGVEDMATPSSRSIGFNINFKL